MEMDMHQDCNDAPHRPARGVGLTLWTGGDLATALRPELRDLLAEARPQIVCVHAGPRRLEAAAARLVHAVRALVPGVRLQLGVGCDYWMGAAIGGVRESVAVDELATAAELADELGAEAVIWDAEAACKIDSLKTYRMARALVGAVRESRPGLIQGHTAYDHPTLHRDDADGVYDDGERRGEYAWRGWIGPDAADWAVPQVYCAPAGGVAFAGPGALARRLATHRASWARAVARGWIRADLPVSAYHQAHHVPFAQTVTIGVESDVVLLWCGPRIAAGGRMDASGEYALRGLCALERAGYRQPGGITAFQRARALTPDGIAGRRTLAALGIHVPADVR